MPRPFHAVLERLTVVVVAVFVVVVDISAPPHVTTRALDESSVQVSITVVAAVRVRRSGDLDDATTDIVDLAGCGGQG